MHTVKCIPKKHPVKCISSNLHSEIHIIICNKKKMKNISYEQLKLQAYMKHPKFGQKEIKLMCLLRSKTCPAKANFRKMNKNNIKCSFLCNTIETQEHIFEKCQPIHTQMKTPRTIQLSKIFGTLSAQVEIIDALM